MIEFSNAQRIISYMTADSWKSIPHLTYQYSADVTDFMQYYKKYKEISNEHNKITINSLMMWVCSQGLKAAPKCNSWLDYDEDSLSGNLHIKSNIDATMPVLFENGMFPVTVTAMENKTILELHKQIAELIQSAKKKDLLTCLQQLLEHIDLREFLLSSEKQMIDEFMQTGTVTISNVGSLYQNQYGGINSLASMNLVAPQVFIIGINAIQKKVVTYIDECGDVQMGIRDILPFTLTFDHRAINFSDVLPFIKRLDEIFADGDSIFFS